jgi:adenylate cyclase class 2
VSPRRRVSPKLARCLISRTERESRRDSPTCKLARNIELKARLHDLAAARNVAQRLATASLGIQQQTDTYFHCRRGRLKLREITGQIAQLVSYERADQVDAKGSDYQLIDVPDPAALKHALSAALGVRIVVAKRREIYLVDNVRVHLDEVAGLGEFLEFEAVLSPGRDDASGHQQLLELQAAFGIRPGDLLAVSYADLLATANQSHRTASSD